MSKQESQDFESGPAVSANLAMLEFATFFKKVLPDTLFEVSGSLVSLHATDEESLLTRAKDRIFTKVSVTDYAQTLEADLTEKAALALTGLETKEEFVEAATTGFLAFERGRLRLRWAISKKPQEKDGASKKTQEPKLTIVAALPKLFDEPEEHLVPASDARILPVQLQWASMSPSGKIGVSLPGHDKKLLATGILALVVGTHEPKTEPVANGFAIKNFVQDTWGEGSSVPWTATTTAITSRLPKYALSKKEKALVHVTYVNPDSKEITIADMWKLKSSDDEKAFQEEVASTTKILMQPVHSLKRKADLFDPTLQGLLPQSAKRMHNVFGGKATPAQM